MWYAGVRLGAGNAMDVQTEPDFDGYRGGKVERRAGVPSGTSKRRVAAANEGRRKRRLGLVTTGRSRW